MASDFISRLQVSESGFAFDPQTGSTFTLNHSALKVFSLLRAGKSTEEILDAVRKDYEVESADARRDIEDFIHSLKEQAKS